MTQSELSRISAAERALVTVGVPVFNGERFLGRALDSLLAQTYSNVDVLISDNASTDATQEICEQYARRDTRVHYIRQPRNMGAPRNWNYLATQARGRYFKWASANDYCDPHLIAACVEILDSRPDVVLCYGSTCIVDNNDSAPVAYEYDFGLDDERPSDRFRRQKMVMGLNNAASGLVRTDVLQRTGMIRLYPAGDLVLMAELALRGKFYLIGGEPLLFRRIAQGSFSGAMSAAELREFLTPGSAARTQGRLILHRDYVTAILRAPIAVVEKLRSLQVAARGAYWDAYRAIYAPLRRAG